jgi:hypothetical protein
MSTTNKIRCDVDGFEEPEEAEITAGDLRTTTPTDRGWAKLVRGDLRTALDVCPPCVARLLK